MKKLTLHRAALSVCAAAIVFAGCDRSQAPPFVPAFRAGGNAGTLPAARRDRINGAVVYTPTNVTVENSTYALSLENDGVTDFHITSNSQYSHTCFYYNSSDQLFIQAGNNGAAVASGWVAVLPQGATIGPSGIFHGGAQEMAKFFSYWQPASVGCVHSVSSAGPWYGITGYAGLAFVRNGKIHYGWAEFTGTAFLWGTLDRYSIRTTLIGYAYQTIPGKAILAGQTR